MAFLQSPPVLGNQYDDDPLLGDYLDRHFAGAARARVGDELRALGEAEAALAGELAEAARRYDMEALARRLEAACGR